MLTPDQYRARRAFLRFQDAFLELKEVIHCQCQIELFSDFEKLDAACREFFLAANQELFSQHLEQRVRALDLLRKE